MKPHLPKIRREFRTKRVATENLEPSLTDQQFKNDCDINLILKKFSKTGQFNHIRQNQGAFLDVSEVQDLLGATEIVDRAHKAFMLLPAQVRADFRNDPQQLIDFLQDPKNDEQAVEMGLKVARQPLPTNDPNEQATGNTTTKKAQKKDANTES